MADYLPLFTPGTSVTFLASADVTGGRLVEISGDRSVATAPADSAKVAGVAGFDAKEGENVTVYSGGVQRPVAAGDIAAGDKVAPAADGKVSTAGEATNTIGLALAAASDGETVQVRFITA